jgi:hypothetical protein
MELVSQRNIFVKTNILIFFIIITPGLLIGQGHDYNWYLGYNTGSKSSNDTTFGLNHFDFSKGNMIISDNQIWNSEFQETNVTISDSSGKLIFLFDGYNFWNHQGGYLKNGRKYHPFPQDTALLTYTFQQNALAFPLSDGSYFFCDMRYVIGKKEGKLTIGDDVDYCKIKKNGNNYEVGPRNKLFTDTVKVRQLTACKHANGRDWWTIAHKNRSNEFVRALVSADTIIRDRFTVSEKIIDGLSQSMFSPDGMNYAVLNIDDFGSNLHLFDFDRCTGALSNQRVLNNPRKDGSGGLAFSPDSKFLYVSLSADVRQYDLSISNSLSSPTAIIPWKPFRDDFNTNFYWMMNAPDGNIYMTITSGARRMYRIRSPNKNGLSCDLEQPPFRIITRNARTLPNNVNTRLGPVDGSICDSLGINNIPYSWWKHEIDTLNRRIINFRDLSSYEPESWRWDFGDGIMSSDTCPVHTFLKDGVYDVCLKVENKNGSNNLCRRLYLGVTSNIEIIEHEIQVFPNPVRDMLAISLGNFVPQNSEILIKDLFGNLVKKINLSPDWNQIDLSELAYGTYFYEIFEKATRIKSGKIIVIK